MALRGLSDACLERSLLEGTADITSRYPRKHCTASHVVNRDVAKLSALAKLDVTRGKPGDGRISGYDGDT
jgi:hypothetical protein